MIIIVKDNVEVIENYLDSHYSTFNFFKVLNGKRSMCVCVCIYIYIYTHTHTHTIVPYIIVNSCLV